MILMGATVLQSAAHHCALDPVQSGDVIAMLKRVHGRPSHSCHDLAGQLLLMRSHVHLDWSPVLPMRFCDRRDPDLRRTLSESHRSEAEDNKHSGLFRSETALPPRTGGSRSDDVSRKTISPLNRQQGNNITLNITRSIGQVCMIRCETSMRAGCWYRSRCWQANEKVRIEIGSAVMFEAIVSESRRPKVESGMGSR